MLCRFNSRKIEYKKPFGAVKCGTEVEFYLEIESPVYPRDVSLSVRFYDGKEKIIPSEYLGMKDGFSSFRVKFTPSEAGLYFYRFRFNSNFGEKFITRSRFGEGVIDSVGSDFQITVYNEFKRTESFFGDLFYQIFPDRFASGGKEKKAVEGRVWAENKGKVPSFRPDEKGIVKNNEFFGGDFDGIREKIPYLKELGVKTVYLNPIFEAQSNHRYDTSDYLKPDSYLGSVEDFKALVDALHKEGMKIILDGVFSHTGDDSIYFNKYGRYESLGAYQSKNSPYYNWYNFKNWPEEYNAWWGIKILPEVNEENEDYVRFICGENGVISYWMGLGIDGFRLDVADELPDSFLKEVYSAVKRENKNAVVIGEVWEDASNKISYSCRRKFLMGEEMDSVMNYPFRDAVINLLKYGATDYFKETVETVLENYPEYAIKNLMNFLSTHDTKRILTALSGEEENGRDKEWMSTKRMTEEERKLGALMVKSAFTVLYMLPGNPQIYYGDEVSMEGYGDPFNRMYYSDEGDRYNTLEYLKKLSAFRSENKDLFSTAKAVIEPIYEGLVIIERELGNKKTVCVLNMSKAAKNIRFLAENAKNLELSTDGYSAENGILEPLNSVVFNF